MPKESRVAIEVSGVSAPEENPLMAQSHLGKATGLQTLSVGGPSVYVAFIG